MTEAPKQIWAFPYTMHNPEDGGFWRIHERKECKSVLYVRADIDDEMRAAAKAVVQKIEPTMEGSVDGDWLGGALFFSDIEIAKLRDAIAKAEIIKPEEVK